MAQAKHGPDGVPDILGVDGEQSDTPEYQKLAARDPLRVERPLTSVISVLMAGAVAETPGESGLSSIVVHAVAGTGASLCGQVPADAQLRIDDGLWSSVPGFERCLECTALS
jgi:hypothetical protein